MEATGVANDTFLCFLGIFKHQKKGVKEDVEERRERESVCVCILFSGGVLGHMAVIAPPIEYTLG